MDRQKEWSDKTFANGEFNYARALPISHHLQKESKELTQAVEKFLKNPTDKTAEDVHEELADNLLLLLDCACHVGVSVTSLAIYAEKKHEVNRKRKYGKPDINGVTE
jgi:NTP pyrophosphatase (non-canonical NTP hydrolase)